MVAVTPKSIVSSVMWIVQFLVVAIWTYLGHEIVKTNVLMILGRRQRKVPPGQLSLIGHSRSDDLKNSLSSVGVLPHSLSCITAQLLRRLAPCPTSLA